MATSNRTLLRAVIVLAVALLIALAAVAVALVLISKQGNQTHALQTKLAVSQKASTQTRVSTVSQRCDLTSQLMAAFSDRPKVASGFGRSYTKCEAQLTQVKAIDAATPGPKAAPPKPQRDSRATDGHAPLRSPMIPKFSAPLSKLIRTGEGIILAAFNATALVGVIVNDVSPVNGLKYAAIFNSVAFASRQFLKAVAVVKPSVGGDPIAAAVGTVTVDSVLAEIDAVEQAVKVVQAQPGTPAEKVTAGLSPSPTSGASSAAGPVTVSTGPAVTA